MLYLIQPLTLCIPVNHFAYLKIDINKLIMKVVDLLDLHLENSIFGLQFIFRVSDSAESFPATFYLLQVLFTLSVNLLTIASDLFSLSATNNFHVHYFHHRFQCYYHEIYFLFQYSSCLKSILFLSSCVKVFFLLLCALPLSKHLLGFLSHKILWEVC